MEPMTDELKETIIREHPDGIWLVLAEEYPPNVVTAHDLLCGRYRATSHSVSTATSRVKPPVSVPVLMDRIAGCRR